MVVGDTSCDSLIKWTKIVFFDMVISFCIEKIFRCKVTEFVKKKPLIIRLYSLVSVCCRLLSDILLVINGLNFSLFYPTIYYFCVKIEYNGKWLRI